MPNLKDIRNRIRSVKSTRKITQAMEMVAAAKVKRAEGRMKAGRPYTDALYDVMTRVYNELKNHVKALSESRYVELLAPRPIKNVGIVVVSSDRGLCGRTLLWWATRSSMRLIAIAIPKCWASWAIVPQPHR